MEQIAAKLIAITPGGKKPDSAGPLSQSIAETDLDTDKQNIGSEFSSQLKEISEPDKSVVESTDSNGDSQLSMSPLHSVESDSEKLPLGDNLLPFKNIEFNKDVFIEHNPNAEADDLAESVVMVSELHNLLVSLDSEMAKSGQSMQSKSGADLAIASPVMNVVGKPLSLKKQTEIPLATARLNIHSDSGGQSTVLNLESLENNKVSEILSDNKFSLELLKKVDIGAMRLLADGGAKPENTSSNIRAGDLSGIYSDLSGVASKNTDSTTKAASLPAMKSSIDNPGWNSEIANKIIWMNKNNIQSAKIRVDPPNLGTIQIKLNITQDQATVSFVSSHAIVREALESGAARLKEMFYEEGFQQLDVDVSGQEHHANNHDKTLENEGQVTWGLSKESEDETAEELSATSAQTVGLIDYFA